MADLDGIIHLGDLTPVAAEAGAAEGDPRPVYTWAGPSRSYTVNICSYTPSDGGARLIADVGNYDFLGVWDTGTGAFLQALHPPKLGQCVWTLVTYQRRSDGRPRIAAGFRARRFCIWDGDDFRLVRAMHVAGAEGRKPTCLAVYEEPTSGSTRLVSA
jgi:hypothetical protein